MSDALLNHRYYRYRACAPAPDADFSGQALGNPDLNVSAWSATDARTQKKAAAACGTCPVREACRASALTGGPQPESRAVHTVLGGMLPEELERARPSAARALELFEDHPRLRYKGCASSPLDPRMSLGNAELPVDAWGAPDIEGGEAPEERSVREAAAKAVCARCPVLVECRTYATSLTPTGQLAEPAGIWGGMTALERHHRLVSWRTAQPAQPVIVTAETLKARLRLEDASTPQKQAVLVALARYTDERDVAWAADMDVRTANWHRSQLCSMLGLDKETATRWQLLTRARELGVLGPIPLKRDGRYPIAAAPNTEGTRQRRLAPEMPVVKVLPLSDERNAPPAEPEGEQSRRRAARRRYRYTVELGVPLAIPGLEYLPRTWPQPKPQPAAPAPVTTGGRHLRPVRTVEPLPLPEPTEPVQERAA